MTEEREELLTEEEYWCLEPSAQGYATYMQAERPGSSIPKTNPHPAGSLEAEQWAEGAHRAVIDVLDGDDE